MLERSELQVLMGRIKEPRKFIQVLMGPRQVGKTTLVTQLLHQTGIPSAYESADSVAGVGSIWLAQKWEAARLRMRANGYTEFLLVFDEIQKVPDWSETVKALWDTDTLRGINIKLILLGSSRLLLGRGLTESLAGRFEVLHMTHWSFDEMRAGFGWDASTFAWFGGYPGSAALIGDEVRWKSYIRDSLIETSISKDILMLTRIDKPALLKKLFEIGCLYSGQVLSFSKIVGQLQDAGNTTTLSHYLSLLETAGLLQGLEKYSQGIIRRRSSSPKFQVHNTALLSAQMPETFTEIVSKPEVWGRIVESAIGAHLVNHSIKSGFTVNYWRERGDEVDFVLKRGEKVIAVEVKSSGMKSARGMQSFQRQYKPDRVYLVDNKSLSWQELLEIDPLLLF